jgi:hypothetical protein
MFSLYSGSHVSYAVIRHEDVRRTAAKEFCEVNILDERFGALCIPNISGLWSSVHDSVPHQGFWVLEKGCRPHAEFESRSQLQLSAVV